MSEPKGLAQFQRGSLGAQHTTKAKTDHIVTDHDGVLGAEITIILVASAVLTLLLLGLVGRFDEALVRALFIR